MVDNSFEQMREGVITNRGIWLEVLTQGLSVESERERERERREEKREREREEKRERIIEIDMESERHNHLKYNLYDFVDYVCRQTIIILWW